MKMKNCYGQACDDIHFISTRDACDFFEYFGEHDVDEILGLSTIASFNVTINAKTKSQAFSLFNHLNLHSCFSSTSFHVTECVFFNFPRDFDG